MPRDDNVIINDLNSFLYHNEMKKLKIVSLFANKISNFLLNLKLIS